MRVPKTWWCALILLAATGCDIAPDLSGIDMSNPDDCACYGGGGGGGYPPPLYEVWINLRDSADVPVDLPAGYLSCIRNGVDTTSAATQLDASLALDPWSCSVHDNDDLTIRVQNAPGWVDSSYALGQTWRDSTVVFRGKSVTLHLAAAQATPPVAP